MRLSSRYTSTPSLMPKGQTPPTGWPMSSSTSSGESILGLKPNLALNLWLSMRASPAARTSSAPPSGFLKESDLAMRAPSTPRALAASSTVADETVNSITRSSMPNWRK